MSVREQAAPLTGLRGRVAAAQPSRRHVLRSAAVGLALILSSTTAAAQDPVMLVDTTGSIPLSGHLAELHDPAGQWTLEDVRQPERAAQFAPVARDAVNHGLSDATSWYRLVLRTPAASANAASDWVLNVAIGTLDYVDIHVTPRNGQTQTTLAGDLRPSPPNMLAFPSYAIPLDLAPGEDVTVHVRVQTTGRHQVLFEVWPQARFLGLAAREGYIIGANYGILLVMALYNLLIFVAIRDRAYAYYVAFILSILFTTSILHCEARDWANAWLPAARPAINACAALIGGVVALTMTLFSREFMQTRVHAPRMHKVTTVLAALAAASIASYPLLGFLATTRLTAAIFAISLLVVLGMGVHLALRGVRTARFFLFAWMILIVGLVLYVLNLFGVLPASFVLFWAPLAGVCAATTLLSLALADRLNVERRDRERFARLKQYLPHQVADLVVSGGNSALLEPKRRQVTVCVIDLRGFTPFSETCAPEDVMNVLREFYSAMGRIIEKHGGTVEHFAGDSMLIFFNAPLEIERPALKAVQTAFEMRATFEDLRKSWSKLGHELGLGIGIADGYATIGAIGFAGRAQYAAIGAVTNLAARLCASAQHGQILTTNRVLAEVEAAVKAESAGEQTMKGFSRPVEVVRLIEAVA